MLYVDGMNGVMKHEPTMQWLYSLIASNYRSVVKTALKLLLVFVEYAESNCYVLVSAIHAVDASQGTLPWSNIMRAYTYIFISIIQFDVFNLIDNNLKLWKLDCAMWPERKPQAAGGLA